MPNPLPAVVPISGNHMSKKSSGHRGLRLNQALMQATHKTKQPIEVFVDYEVRASWWVQWVSWAWLQHLAARYFAWKVKRKYRRYLWAFEQFLLAADSKTEGSLND